MTMQPQENYWNNEVAVTGKLHFVNGGQHYVGKHSKKPYFKFAIRTETADNVNVNGGYRPNYIIVRAYNSEVISAVKSKEEGDIISIVGELVSSRGSGEMFVLYSDVDE